ncbi:MAG: 8-amino-7-oxononanoate synthase [Pseudomonadota bacterium]
MTSENYYLENKSDKENKYDVEKSCDSEKRYDSDKLRSSLETLHQQRRYRQPPTIEHRAPGRITINNHSYISFASNDYLGLSQDEKLNELFTKINSHQINSSHGFGSGASPMVTGYDSSYQLLEQRIAKFLEVEEVVLFSSGYHANLGVLSAWLQVGQVAFMDELCHASLIDGVRLSSAKLQRYPHLDSEHLIQAWQKKSAALWITDGVFSMDGDYPDLKKYCTIADEFHVPLYVDDAHGFGVLGVTGKGIAEAQKISVNQLDFYTASLGKAMGGMGAFVAANKEICEWMRQYVRTYMFDTALSPLIISAMHLTLSAIQNESWRRHKLQNLIELLRAELIRHGFTLSSSTTHIQPIILGNENLTLKMAEDLAQKGFWVPAIRPPSVPNGTSRLRISLSSAHEEADIHALIDALCQSREGRREIDL